MTDETQFDAGGGGGHAPAATVSATSQSLLLDTLDSVLDAVHSAAVEHRLLRAADVIDMRELRRAWEPVVCRDGEVRDDDDDPTTCCTLTQSMSEGQVNCVGVGCSFP